MLRGRALPHPVTHSGVERLTPGQAALVGEWLPGFVVVHDHSWGLTSTVVLEVRAAGAHFVVKAADASDGHFPREVRAHREWLEPWTARGRAPRLRHVDEGQRVLVTEFLPGTLVQGGAGEGEPDVYRQAGELLAQLHGQGSRVVAGYEEAERAKALAWLEKPHRIPDLAVERLREDVSSWIVPAATKVVATHGDWQPRNWIIDGGLVSAIDFGRADLRPALTDFSRLSVQQFRGRPDLERAFIEGYGSDPRDDESWRRQRVREAISTAAWAHQVGDDEFEQQGHRMIADVLETEGAGT
ncbi:phosphotransferase [Knoellia subterranea]|uniref:Aminoglycoside phosphotransferase n=1 Tax=Knoellia subterranea KCTC 19937 TaxID=1385521 RepID=A0A0A0JNC9_9MICO|nr:aminoglycoside phosphotransferase family protein [Knoellia subterranea]KGN38648.1 aminoglycoside phosphotransferase [Knoellia subterranea KCTC 19937]